MNSKNINTSYFRELLLKLTEKADLRRSEKTVVLSSLGINSAWKIWKAYIIKKTYLNLKYFLQLKI